MQVVGCEAIGQGLRALQSVDPQEGVSARVKPIPGGSEAAGQPTVPVAIELEANGHQVGTRR